MYQPVEPKKSNKATWIILGGILAVILGVAIFPVAKALFKESSLGSGTPAGIVGQELGPVDFFPGTSLFGDSEGTILIHSAEWKGKKLVLDVEVTATKDRVTVSSAYFYGERNGIIYNYEVLPDIENELPSLETVQAGESIRGSVVLEPKSYVDSGPIKVTMTNATMRTPVATWDIQ